MAELKSCLDNTPITLLSIKIMKSLYIYSYLLAGANNFRGKFEIRPQKVISGPNGHRSLDVAIDLCKTAKMVGITEVKKDDFVKGVAQCAVQLESSLSNRKRKANEIEEEQVFGRVFGIVTDAENSILWNVQWMIKIGQASNYQKWWSLYITTRICKIRWKRFSDILYGCWKRHKNRTRLLT
jgi:hypothetical protein